MSEPVGGMSAPVFWDGLARLFHRIRTFTAELWKVWCWFGLGLLGFATYDASLELSALVFAITATTVGIVTLAAWIGTDLVGGLTEKGRTGGRFWSVFTATLICYLAIVFAVMIWLYSAIAALPIFR